MKAVGREFVPQTDQIDGPCGSGSHSTSGGGLNLRRQARGHPLRTLAGVQVFTTAMATSLAYGIMVTKQLICEAEQLLDLFAHVSND